MNLLRSLDVLKVKAGYVVLQHFVEVVQQFFSKEDARGVIRQLLERRAVVVKNLMLQAPPLIEVVLAGKLYSFLLIIHLCPH
jgi:hypothetical protein